MHLIARLLKPTHQNQDSRAICQEHPNFWMYRCQ